MRELQQQIDSIEFEHWKVFCNRFEPFGDEWRQNARIVAAIINGAGGVDGRAVTTEELIPRIAPDPTDEELELKMEAAAWAASVADRPDPDGD